MPRKSPKNAPRGYSKHGLTTLKQTLNALGGRAIDRRSKLSRALTAWRTALVEDLGGDGQVSTQQQAVVDLCVRTKILLDSVDVWLLQQPSLINKTKRALLPVVLQRQQLADALARYMTALGLERRVRPVPKLAEYLEKYADQNQ